MSILRFDLPPTFSGQYFLLILEILIITSVFTVGEIMRDFQKGLNIFTHLKAKIGFYSVFIQK